MTHDTCLHVVGTKHLHFDGSFYLFMLPRDYPNFVTRSGPPRESLVRVGLCSLRHPPEYRVSLVSCSSSLMESRLRSCLLGCRPPHSVHRIDVTTLFTVRSIGLCSTQTKITPHRQSPFDLISPKRRCSSRLLPSIGTFILLRNRFTQCFWVIYCIPWRFWVMTLS